MAGELVVADNQDQIRDLLIGPGSKYRWETTPSLWGGASLDTNDTPYSSRDGVRGGRDLLRVRPLNGRIAILANDGPDLLACLDGLATAWLPSDDNVPFVGQRLGSKRRRYGRPRRWSVVDDATTMEHSALVAVEFEALDPNVYSDLEHATGVGLPVAGTGFTAPVVPPFTLGASSSGSGTVFNAGNSPAPWTARFDGPLTNPEIIHIGQGRTLDFSINGGVTLAAGEFLFLDSQTASALLNGTTDRRVALELGSRWFDLDVGSNTIAFNADAGSGTLTINWRDTWR